MTPKQEAAMLDALNALLRVQPQVRGAIPQQDVEDAIDTLRAALAEPVQDGTCKYCTNGCPACDARKQRKPLTDEEIGKMWVGILEATHPSGVHEDGLVPFRFARAIERAHGIGKTVRSER